MKLSISSVALPQIPFADIIPILKKYRVSGLEIAPSLASKDPLSTTEKQARAYGEKWAKYGIQIVAMQSLLYSHPDLNILRKTDHQKILEVWKKLVELALARYQEHGIRFHEKSSVGRSFSRKIPGNRIGFL